MNDDFSSSPNNISWRRTALVAAVWVLGCPIAGFVLALLSGEFGSIGFVVVGLYVGIVGGVGHALFSRAKWFVGCRYSLQVLIAAAAAALPLLAVSLVVVRTGVVGFVQLFALPICGFTLAAAWVGTEIVRRQSA
jgi:hypothetical protein